MLYTFICYIAYCEISSSKFWYRAVQQRTRTSFFFYTVIISILGRNPMSSCSPSPSSLPKAYSHSQHTAAPPTPSPSPSPPATLYSRLSNGSLCAPSPTLSRCSFHGVSFLLQIGLTRETVSLEAHDLSLSSVKDLVCSIVDQKVGPLMFYFVITSVIVRRWSPSYKLSLAVCAL